MTDQLRYARLARLHTFLALYGDPPRWPAAVDPAHTHGGNRFITFEGTTVAFCSACALGLPPDAPRVVNDGAMDPRD